MTFDPIGPGTPAWNAFDRALETARAVGPSGALPKTYHNQRQHMKACLRAHVDPGTIRQWCDDLDRRVYEETNRVIKPGP